ncbi:hypothetical protein V5N11_009311 [Cardamine amara subsp. amara]|uniref:Uncharacterized protein n=1 Tax=Cardamine amara subsp. amara TaxID=228776 RepID=A0ABD0ZE30_CARAN
MGDFISLSSLAVNDNDLVIAYFSSLKGSTIAQLFEEILRVNPKIKSHEMVDEIKRKYNMIVNIHQCKRAKSLLFQEGRLVMNHTLQESGCNIPVSEKRLRYLIWLPTVAVGALYWDYQEEIRRSNM